MIKIALYSENSCNIKNIYSLIGEWDEFSLVHGDYKDRPEDDTPPSDADLVLLDLSGLPVDEGSLRSLSKSNNGILGRSSAVKILILEPGQEASLVEDFLFADDFLFTDHLAEELVPRIRLLLFRKKLVLPAHSLVIGDMVLNMEKYELTVNGRAIVLTYKEFEMLKLLMQNRDRVFTRIDLLSTVWGYDYYGGSRTVDVHMRRLRAKIPTPYNNMLKTIRNVGYIFSPEE